MFTYNMLKNSIRVFFGIIFLASLFFISRIYANAQCVSPKAFCAAACGGCYYDSSFSCPWDYSETGRNLLNEPFCCRDGWPICVDNGVMCSPAGGNCGFNRCDCGGGGGGGNNPKGYHDESSCTWGAAGWACDDDDLGQNVTVRIFIDGAQVADVVANQPAVNAADAAGVGGQCGGNSSRRFWWALPNTYKNGAPRSIRVVALNLGGGSDADLTNTPRSVTCVQAPNCKSLSGPMRVNTGISNTFSGVWENGAGSLTAASVTVVPAGSACNIAGLPSTIPISSPLVSGATRSFSWAAPSPGNYTLLCRAWNDGIAECRGTCVDGPPRYTCAGPTATMNVCTLPTGPSNPSTTSVNNCGAGTSAITLNWRYNPADYYNGSPTRFDIWVNDRSDSWVNGCVGRPNDTCLVGAIPGTTAGLTCNPGLGTCSYTFNGRPGTDYDWSLLTSNSCEGSTTGVGLALHSTAPCARTITGRVGETTSGSCTTASLTNGFDAVPVSVTLTSTGPGTITASPNPTTTNATGDYSTSVQYTPTGTTTGSFCATSGIPSGPGYVFRPTCVSAGVRSGNCAINVPVNPGPAANVNIGFERVPSSGWFQSLYGDVFSAGALTKSLPNSSPAIYDTGTISYLVDGSNTLAQSTNGLVVSRGGITIRNLSNTQTRASSGAGGYVNYNYASYNTPTGGTFPFPATISFTTGPAGAVNISGVACSSFFNNSQTVGRAYRFANAGCFTNALNGATGNRYNFTGTDGGVAVVYVPESITVDRNLANAAGSNDRLVLVVGGNVTFSSSVGSTLTIAQTTPGNIDATIIASGSITVQSDGSNQDRILKVDGALISNSNINMLSRSRSSAPDANTIPTQVIEYLPREILRLNDMELNMPTGSTSGLFVSNVTFSSK